MAERNQSERAREEEEYSLKKPLLMLVIVILLAAGGWYLIQTLGGAGRMQDCVMRGGRNCARIDTGDDR